MHARGTGFDPLHLHFHFFSAFFLLCCVMMLIFLSSKNCIRILLAIRLQMAVPLSNLAPNLLVSNLCLGYLYLLLSLLFSTSMDYQFTQIFAFCITGTMTFGEQNSLSESFKLMDKAFDSGINFFDSAEM